MRKYKKFDRKGNKKKKVFPITYILGAKCKDGVVLIADRKVSDGTYVKKIIPLPNFESIVFCAAGIKPLFEEFLNELPRRVVSNYNYLMYQKKDLPKEAQYGYTYNLYHFRHDCVSLLNEMHKIYEDSEIPDDSTALQVLFIVNEEMGGVLKPRLYGIDWETRYAVPIEEKEVIGQGYLADVFLKSWDPEYTINQTIRLGAFIIRYIEKEELSYNKNSVGVGNQYPQVYICKIGENPKELTKEELDKILKGIYEEVDKKIKEIGSKSNFLNQ